MESAEKPVPLLAAASEIDITPPLEVGLLMSSAKQQWEPFESKRLPLFAKVLLLKSGGNFAVLCSLDLLGLASDAVGGWDLFKQRICKAAGNVLSPWQIVIACTHTHSGPESLALSDLYQCESFQRWIDQLVLNLGKAVKECSEKLVPATLFYGSALAPGLSLLRRIKTSDGIKLTHELTPEQIPDSYRKNVDERVQVLSVRQSSGELIALMVHAVCHPVIEMCIRSISPDYPGELALALQNQFHVPVLFFNGASGNINPVDICGGPEKARLHGAALAKAAVECIDNSKILSEEYFSLSWEEAELPARDEMGYNLNCPVLAYLAKLQIGDLLLLFLPGEIFLETGLAIEKSFQPIKTLVIGFAEAYIGYVCPKEVFEEGGYETGPGRWSTLQPGAEKILREAAMWGSFVPNPERNSDFQRD